MQKKLENVNDLLALREQAQALLRLRSGAKEMTITVHMGTCGIAAGAREVLAALAEELEKAEARNVTLRQAGCAGLCDREPMFTVGDAAGHQFCYGKLDANKVHKIVQSHIVGGSPVVEHLITK